MDKHNKKLLLIFPPQWTPISPHFAIPQLVGQLKAKGFNASALDLNIDFFNEILTPDSLKYSIQLAQNELEILKKNLMTVFSIEKKSSDYTFEEQIFLYRYNQINKFLQTNNDFLSIIPSIIENAKTTVKNNDFYSPAKLIESVNIIDRALEVISIPYSPLCSSIHLINLSIASSKNSISGFTIATYSPLAMETPRLLFAPKPNGWLFLVVITSG